MIKKVLFDGKVEVGISETSDGNMRFFGEGDEGEIIENQRRLGSSFTGSESRLARVRTIYDERKDFTDYRELTEENLGDYAIENPEGEILVSDGLVTRDSKIGLFLPLADCLGVVVFDERQGILGLLHAGRHNIEQEGAKKFIEYFKEKFGSEARDLALYFSPHAVNYPIFKFGGRGLSEVATEQFLDSGVLGENIFNPKIDTVKSANFPSYSSGDKFKRFAIAAKIKQESV
ncbi:polyphenol oxidase family protein [Candidatus Saccharibacteria bacterium]|nr:polyphenol oxidase family protein [Candidatus Saccharibacteria bacterium]